jgi:hypothetical protein
LIDEAIGVLIIFLFGNSYPVPVNELSSGPGSHPEKCCSRGRHGEAARDDGLLRVFPAARQVGER